MFGWLTTLVHSPFILYITPKYNIGNTVCTYTAHVMCTIARRVYCVGFVYLCSSRYTCKNGSGMCDLIVRANARRSLVLSGRLCILKPCASHVHSTHCAYVFIVYIVYIFIILLYIRKNTVASANRNARCVSTFLVLCTLVCGR